MNPNSIIIIMFNYYCWNLMIHEILMYIYIVIELQGLLSSPEPDDPLDTNVAEHWKTNEKAAMERAREWTQRYAS